MATPPLYLPRNLLGLPENYTTDQARRHYRALVQRYTANDAHTRTVRRLLRDA